MTVVEIVHVFTGVSGPVRETCADCSHFQEGPLIAPYNGWCDLMTAWCAVALPYWCAEYQPKP